MYSSQKICTLFRKYNYLTVLNGKIPYLIISDNILCLYLGVFRLDLLLLYNISLLITLDFHNTYAVETPSSNDLRSN